MKLELAFQECTLCYPSP